MFTLEHFVWIGICVIFISALSFVSIKFKFSFKVASYIMLGIAVCSELLKIFTHIEGAEATLSQQRFRFTCAQF